MLENFIYFLLFAVGFCMHVLMQAQASVKSTSNGIHQIRDWLAMCWVIVLVRFFLSALIMGVWLIMPGIFAHIVALVTGNTYDIPLNAVTAALFGYLVDSVLDKIAAIAGMQIQVPQVSPPPIA